MQRIYSGEEGFNNEVDAEDGLIGTEFMIK
jgi:hypothetical protein